MSDAPERIWLTLGFGEDDGYAVEYVRADCGSFYQEKDIDALLAERDYLLDERNELRAERDKLKTALIHIKGMPYGWRLPIIGKDRLRAVLGRNVEIARVALCDMEEM